MNSSDTNKLIDQIKSLLEKQFSPTLLEIKDESAAHAGHVGAQGGMKHLALTISSQLLNKMPMLLAHKAIYEALGELMHTHIHALRIKIIKSEQD
jgi:BolA protein